MLTHGQADEKSQLDDLRRFKMRVQSGPQLVAGLQPPGDGLGQTQSGFLARRETLGFVKLQQGQHIVFDHAQSLRLHRALVAAVIAIDRLRHIQPANLLDGVVANALHKGVVPGVGKRPEHRRYMGADGVTLRAGRSIAGGTLKLGAHGRLGDARRINIRNALGSGCHQESPVSSEATALS